MRNIWMLILLTIGLLAPVAATYIKLQSEKSRLRHQIKEHLIKNVSRNRLSTIVVNKHNAQKLLKWEHEKEFEYLGCMYDVVEKSVKGDSITYLCWKDDEESELNKELDLLVIKIFDNDPYQKEHSNKLVSFYKKLFFEQIRNLTVNMAVDSNNMVCIHYRSFFANAFYEHETPPPQFTST